MNFKISLLVGLLAATFFACKNDKPATPPPPVKWAALKLKEQICLFPKDTLRCAKVSLDIPQIGTGLDSLAARSVNDSLLKFGLACLQPMESAAIIGDPEKVVKSFIDSYELFAKENADAPFGYEADVNGKALFSSSKIVSAELNSYIFTGGAHPNHWTNLASFNRATGKKLTAADLFSDQAAVIKLLEKPFVDAKKDGMPEAKTPTDLMFPDTKFGFPENIAVVKEGIRFYYNPYELTAYALGDFDLLLTWEQLGGLVKKEVWLD